MSGARPPKLTSANHSTHIRGLRYHLSACAMLFAQLLRFAADLDEVLQDWILSVPLDEVGTSHERSVFCRAAIIMPEVKVLEGDRLFKGSPGQHTIFFESLHHRLAGLHFFVGCADHSFGFPVHSFDHRWCMALR